MRCLDLPSTNVNDRDSSQLEAENLGGGVVPHLPCAYNGDARKVRLSVRSVIVRVCGQSLLTIKFCYT